MITRDQGPTRLAWWGHEAQVARAPATLTERPAVATFSRWKRFMVCPVTTPYTGRLIVNNARTEDVWDMNVLTGTGQRLFARALCVHDQVVATVYNGRWLVVRAAAILTGLETWHAVMTSKFPDTREERWHQPVTAFPDRGPSPNRMYSMADTGAHLAGHNPNRKRTVVWDVEHQRQLYGLRNTLAPFTFISDEVLACPGADTDYLHLYDIRASGTPVVRVQQAEDETPPCALATCRDAIVWASGFGDIFRLSSGKYQCVSRAPTVTRWIQMHAWPHRRSHVVLACGHQYVHGSDPSPVIKAVNVARSCPVAEWRKYWAAFSGITDVDGLPVFAHSNPDPPVRIMI